MPKKHRKVRVGSRLWSEQRERDLRNQQGRPRPSSKRKEPPDRGRWRQQPRPAPNNDADAEGEDDSQQSQSQPPPPPPRATSTTSKRRVNLRCLGLTPLQDTLENIKKAYRTLARQLHPDKNCAADATERMKAVNAAYAFLRGE
jgi:hypothetical protein